MYLQRANVEATSQKRWITTLWMNWINKM